MASSASECGLRVHTHTHTAVTSLRGGKKTRFESLRVLRCGDRGLAFYEPPPPQTNHHLCLLLIVGTCMRPMLLPLKHRSGIKYNPCTHQQQTGPYMCQRKSSIYLFTTCAPYRRVPILTSGEIRILVEKCDVLRTSAFLTSVLLS